MHSVYADMAAARYSSDVLQMCYGPIPREEKTNLPEPLKPDFTALFDGFLISQNNFQEWLRVWRMDISERNPNKKDLLKFARENKEKITDLVEQEAQRLNSVKVSFGLQVKFSIERNGETQYMEHYFEDGKPHVFERNDEEQIKQNVPEFFSYWRNVCTVYTPTWLPQDICPMFCKQSTVNFPRPFKTSLQSFVRQFTRSISQ